MAKSLPAYLKWVIRERVGLNKKTCWHGVPRRLAIRGAPCRFEEDAGQVEALSNVQENWDSLPISC